MSNKKTELREKTASQILSILMADTDLESPQINILADKISRVVFQAFKEAGWKSPEEIFHQTQPPIVGNEQLKPVIGKTLDGESLNPTVRDAQGGKL